MKSTLLESVRAAGAILLDHAGKQVNVRQKGEQSSVVTDADLAAEHYIVERIRSRFPSHAIVAEESGYTAGTAEFTWVIDPLDGTSNFAAGLPWWGVQIALLQHSAPIMAAMFLPASNTLYWAEKGAGVYRNDERVRVTPETNLKNVLCAFGLDAAASEPERRRQADQLIRLASRVRNIRATNSLLDVGYTVDGRLGAVVNLNTKIWDIAPGWLMLPEAGGRLTELSGASIEFCPSRDPIDRSYAVVGASEALHAQLLRAQFRAHQQNAASPLPDG